MKSATAILLTFLFACLSIGLLPDPLNTLHRVFDNRQLSIDHLFTPVAYASGNGNYNSNSNSNSNHNHNHNHNHNSNSNDNSDDYYKKARPRVKQY